MPLADDVDLDALSTQAEGLSGAETVLVPREAGLKALTVDNAIESLNSSADIKAFKISKQIVEGAL